MALCVMMISAVLTDIKVHRITNVLVMMVLFLGLTSQLALHGSMGVAYWVTGLAVGFAMFLPFYIGGGMGAGDVKLMAAVGSVFGFSGAIAAGATALIAGLPLAIIMVLHRYLSERDSIRHAATALHGGRAPHAGVKAVVREGRKERIPYAAAIAIGSIGGLWWNGNLQQLSGVLLP